MSDARLKALEVVAERAKDLRVSVQDDLDAEPVNSKEPSFLAMRALCDALDALPAQVIAATVERGS
jgi:hypothetical protein